ncbi:MAG: hypothetical protein WCW25_04465 [Patescibacteria group bacterium]|jgi:hypothetical protein
MIKPYYLLIITPVFLFFSAEFIDYYPGSLYYLLPLANALLIFTVYNLIKKTSFLGSLDFFIFPLVFFNSSLANLVVLNNEFFVQGLIFFSIGMVWYYLKAVYFFHYEPLFYKSFQIRNISVYGNFLAVFFFSSALFGMRSFLNWPVWGIVLVLTFLFLLVIYQLSWAHKIPPVDSGVHIFVDSLILIEIAWSLSFLPLRFYILGLLLSAAYYVITGLTRHYLLGSLEAKNVKTYIGIGLFSVIIILLSSRWI